MRASKRISMIPFLLFSVAPLPLLPLTASSVQVVVAGRPVQMPEGLQSYMEDDVAMVPARPVLEALGATVTWDQQNRTVTGERDCHLVSLRDGDTAAAVDGSVQTMQAPARTIGSELYAPLGTLAQALDRKLEWDPQSGVATVSDKSLAGGQAQVTLTFPAAGTVMSPSTYRGLAGAKWVAQGAYRWVLDTVGPDATFAWTFIPDNTGPVRYATVVRSNNALHVASDSTDLRVELEHTTQTVYWDYEQAARTATGKLTGALTAADLARVTSLTLPEHTAAVSDLCRFPNLTSLSLQSGLAYSPDFLDAALSVAPRVQSLTLTGSDELPSDVPLPDRDTLPYRVETPHGIFLGDRGMTMTELVSYAKAFEEIGIPELAKDTGLRPTRRKVVFQIYGDEKAWNAVSNGLQVWGYFTGQEDRIYMAHWRSPETINRVLLYHEFFHWLAWEEGHVNLPTWLNEGLAHNLSWRVEQATNQYTNPFVRREWLKVTGHPETPVPELATHQKQDEYTITAVAYLLATRGREDLTHFFELTQGDMEFKDAFAKAFGTTSESYIAEYGRHVAALRSKSG